MLINIDDIKVSDRIRKDCGNIDELAEDIKKNGLINPIAVTSDYELIAGERRLRALQMLGAEEVEVRIIDVRNAEHQLLLEISENENRKDFSMLERLDYAKQLERIESVRARKRMEDPMQNFAQGEEGNTRDKVAKKINIGSGEQLRKQKYIAENADEETLKAWDQGDISTHKAYSKIKELKEEVKRQKQANESLIKQIEEQQEPEIIEKEVIKEVTKEPNDYREIKRENEKLRGRIEEAKRNEKQALSKLNNQQTKKKITTDAMAFAFDTANYIKTVGGYIYLTDYINDLPAHEREMFERSISQLKEFADDLKLKYMERVEFK